MPEDSLRSQPGHDLVLVRNTQVYLHYLLQTQPYRDSIEVPNKMRKVFCVEGASEVGLRQMTAAMDLLVKEIEQGLSRSFRKLAEARACFTNAGLQSVTKSSMSDWEDTFKSWAKGPGTTEQTKCDNAETAIRKAIAANPELAAMEISVFAQGSDRNRTNVKQDSDVDICVRLDTTFFPDYPAGTTEGDFGNKDSDITFKEYRNLIQSALKDYFGAKNVKRGNKAFDIHENTYRVDANVVAAFEHRRYTGKQLADGSHKYLSGIGFLTDKGQLILNWPDHAYENGVWKHESTGRRVPQPASRKGGYAGCFSFVISTRFQGSGVQEGRPQGGF